MDGDDSRWRHPSVPGPQRFVWVGGPKDGAWFQADAPPDGYVIESPTRANGPWRVLWVEPSHR